MAYDRSLLTVVTPAADPSLVDLATVKDELDITTSSTDARFTRWIRETKDEIQGCIGRVLRAELVSEMFRGGYYGQNAPGEHFPPYDSYDRSSSAVRGLVLRRYPVVTIYTITENGSTILDPVSDYETDAELGIVYRLSGSSRINWSGQTVQVDYAGGYAALTDVPGDIVAANLTLIKHRQAGQTREPGLRAMNVPGVLERQWYVPGAGEQGPLPQEVMNLIERYRDLRM